MIIGIDNRRKHEYYLSNCFVLSAAHRSRHVNIHDHDGIEIFYVVSGAAVNNIYYPDNTVEHIDVTEGDYFFMEHGLFHNFTEGTDSFKVINLLFKPTLIHNAYPPDQALSELITRKPFYFSPDMLPSEPFRLPYRDDNGEILNIMKKALKVYNAQCYGYTEFLRCYVIETILRTLSPKVIKENVTQKKTNKIVLEICDYIAINYKEPISLESIGKKFFLSPKHAGKLFKSNTGTTFSLYLQEVRMSHAQQMLRETDMTVDAICEAIGYNNITAFRKIFIKHTGKTPSEYRKEAQTRAFDS